MNKNEKIRQLYLAALQEQAFHHATTIEQLIERLENGELPSMGASGLPVTFNL